MHYSSWIAMLTTCAVACNGSNVSPSKDEIKSIFSHITGENPAAQDFFSHVATNVNWTIEGTHPAAGIYTNRSVLEATFLRINAVASPTHPFVLQLINVIRDEDDDWSVQELSVKGICKNGLIFDNRYAWATRWNDNATIIEARAYLDSALVSAALQQNEVGTLFTYLDPRDEILPFTRLSAAQVLNATGLRNEPNVPSQ